MRESRKSCIPKILIENNQKNENLRILSENLKTNNENLRIPFENVQIIKIIKIFKRITKKMRIIEFH